MHLNEAQVPASRVIVLVFVVGTLLLAPASNAEACSCLRDFSCSEDIKSDAIFVGRVLTVTDTGRVTDGVRVTIQVVEVMKGVETGTLTVFTGRNDGDCGFPFKAGGEYLVYAYVTPEGGLLTGTCGSTMALRDAGSRLAELRARRDYRPDAAITLSGHVRLVGLSYEVLKDVPPAAVIRATSAGRSFVTRTAAGGEYRFEGLPSGRYTLTADIADGFEPRLLSVPYDFTNPQTCHRPDFVVRYTGRVRGRVTTSSGRAVPGLPVQVFAAEELDSPQRYRRVQAVTDSNGNYEFEHVPPGLYLLEALTFLPRDCDSTGPRVVYQGDSREAQTIVMTRNQRVSLPNFVMPASAALVEVRGVVRDPSGRGRGDAQVHLSDVGPIPTRKDGTFTLSLAERRRYSIMATVSDDGGRTGVNLFGSQRFVAGENPGPLVVSIK